MKRDHVDVNPRACATVPKGLPSYDDPDVQAVACELLGDPFGSYWSKPVETNPATALHAAVRAVAVIRQQHGTPVDGAALRELVRYAGEMSGMLTPQHTERLEARVRALAEGLRS